MLEVIFKNITFVNPKCFGLINLIWYTVLYVSSFSGKLAAGISHGQMKLSKSMYVHYLDEIIEIIPLTTSRCSEWWIFIISQEAEASLKVLGCSVMSPNEYTK